MTFFFHTLQGRRDANEDTHIIFENLNKKYKNKAKLNIYGVFDGHGGKLVSKYLKENIPSYFTYKNCEKNFIDKPTAVKYLKKVFDKIEDNLEKHHPIASKRCGSTCNLIIITDNHIYNANLGDSRSVLCKKNNISKILSVDHKPDLDKEKSRIEKLGGSIRYDGSDWRVNDLSLSRAFGDVESKPFISHRPDVYKYKKCKDDKFIIIACDGLWDVLSPQFACDFVYKLLKEKKKNIAKHLAEYAYNKGSYDNVSVIIKIF